MLFIKKKAALPPLPAGFTVTAHSGAYNTPDNSLEFVKRVLAEGCGVIEMDVTFRPSGVPVIVHDGAPKETEGVLLAEVFSLIAQSPAPRMNLDLKSTVNLPAVDALLREYGLFARAFYTGVGKDWAPAVKAASAVPYYLNLDVSKAARTDPAAADALSETVLSFGAVGLNVHYDCVSALNVSSAHAHGLLASLWTANNEQAMLKCLAMAPDNITTRHPDKLKALIERKQV